MAYCQVESLQIALIDLCNFKDWLLISWKVGRRQTSCKKWVTDRESIGQDGQAEWLIKGRRKS